MKKTFVFVLLISIFSLAQVSSLFAAITRIPITTVNGQEPNAACGSFSSYSPAVISGNNRYVAFECYASNVVPGDTNNVQDIMVSDLTTGQIIRANVASNGTQANSASYSPSISNDGRYVAFSSTATNLVPNDTNNSLDVFVHDMVSGETKRASVASDGTQANNIIFYVNSISGDGRYVAFFSYASNLVAGDTNNNADIFVHDMVTGQTIRASVASDGSQAIGGESQLPKMSGDGRYVVFPSGATNLVPGGSNGPFDIFVRDMVNGTTTQVNVASDGTKANGNRSRGGPPPYASISADGRFVVFTSDATNLVPNDTNNSMDIFVHDMTTGQTSRASVASDGTQADVNYLYLSPIQPFSGITNDGRYVVFSSDARNLVANDTNNAMDIFVHDMLNGQTTRVNLAADGTPANGGSFFPTISGDGRYVVFESYANNVIGTTGYTKTFVTDFILPNNRPILNVSGDLAAKPGDAIQLWINFSDPDGDKPTITADMALTLGAQLTQEGKDLYSFYWKTSASGSFSVKFTANDGKGGITEVTKILTVAKGAGK